MLRRLLFVSLAATVLYGWFVMVYPVLSTDSVRFWSLVLGYTLGSLGSVFVLCRSAMSVWSTTIPAAAALLVVASFRNEAEVHAYLVVAGVTGFVYLAIDSLPSNDDPRYGRRRERGLCGIVEGRFFQRRVDPGLRRQNGRLRRSANEAFGMSLLSFEKDLAPSGGELFGATIVNVGRCHKADSRVPWWKL